MEKTIGIVGGVGPLAGIDLQRKIVAQTAAGKDQDHLTVLSLSQPGTILDRTEYLLGQVDKNPGCALAGQLQALADAGAQVAGIPCNTAHAPAIWDVMQAELAQSDCRIQVLHMIEEVGRFLQEQFPEVRQVGVLSTTGTYRTRIYPQLLAPLGYTAVTPNIAMQETRIHPAVYDPTYGIKACGRVTQRARADLLAGAAVLRQAGAQTLILGCTEMPLALPETHLDGLPLIDATLILARALIREANPARLRRPSLG